MKKETIASLFMECILLSLTAGSLSAAFLTSLNIEFNLLYIVLLTALVCLVLRFVLQNKRTTLVFVSLILFTAIAIGFLTNPQNFISSTINYFSWLISFVAGSVGIIHSYATATVFITAILIAVIFHVLNNKLRLFILPLILGMGLLFTLWYLNNKEISLYIWLFALASIISWSGAYHRTLSRQFQLPDRGFWQACVLPIAILITLTATVITPSKDAKNLQWDYLVNAINDIDDQLFGYKGTRKTFRLSNVGFSSSSNRLGGPVKANEDLALRVSSPLPLLLRASVLNEYTGSAWIGSIQNTRYRYTDKNTRVDRESTYDLDEYIWYNVDHAEEDNPFYLPIQATITHSGIDASVLFHAQNLVDVNMDKGRAVPYHNTSSELFANREIREDESYTIVSAIPLLSDNSALEGYLRTASPTLDWTQPINEYLSDGAYNEKIQDIYRGYTQLPDTIPDRVELLTRLITEGQLTAYDKMIAIKDYLTNGNYAYTLSPPETPKGRDFVDYFLFDLKEGYCTYYASAMAIMGRLAGVPTRYIEGFSMPAEPANDGLYEVKNINGHAWVEVYFPEVGWIPMDPTPGSRVGIAPPTQQLPQSDRYWEEYYRRLNEQMRQEHQQGPQDRDQSPKMDQELLRQG
ncbi:MAG TPA: transglutaminase domain-containing protein, partial [Bacillota bacterium]|nr:transglutaminase domain-containing protein [Bacillota bacterium]